MTLSNSYPVARTKEIAVEIQDFFTSSDAEPNKARILDRVKAVLYHLNTNMQSDGTSDWCICEMQRALDPLCGALDDNLKFSTKPSTDAQGFFAAMKSLLDDTDSIYRAACASYDKYLDERRAIESTPEWRAQQEIRYNAMLVERQKRWDEFLVQSEAEEVAKAAEKRKYLDAWWVHKQSMQNALTDIMKMFK